MNISTHAGQNILNVLELDPSATGPWQQLMLLCFDQRDIETFETLRLVLDGLHKVHAARKNEAKKQFEEALAKMRASGVVSAQALPKPIASTFQLTEAQRTNLCQLARSPNSTKCLEKVGRIFAEDWKQPEVAQKFYERAMCYEAESDDVLRSLAQAVETLSSHMPAARSRLSGHLPTSIGFGGSGEEDQPDLHEMSLRSGPLPGDTVRMSVLKNPDNTRILPHGEQPDTLTLAGVQGFLQRISKPLLQAAKMLEASQEAQTSATSTSTLSRARVEPSATALHAQELTENGNLIEAKSLLQQNAEDTTAWPVWVNVGLSHFEQGQIPQAIEAFQTASQHQPDAVEPHFNLGVALFRAGRTQEAIASYQRASELDPENPKVACNLGAVYFQEGRLAEAEESFRKAIQNQPDYAKAWDNLASVLGSGHRLEEAEEACRKAIEINPYYAEPKFKLGTVLYHLGRRDEAKVIFEEVVKLRPDWGDSRVYLALIEARNKNIEAAREALEGASGLVADADLSSLAWQALAELILPSSPTEALPLLLKASELGPDHERTWGFLSQAYLQVDDPQRAEDAARKWTDLAPKSFSAWQHLGAICYAQDKFAESVVAFQKATELNPGVCTIWCDLGASLQMSGDLPGAIAALEQASQVEPTNLTPWIRLAHIYFHQKKFSEAIAAFEHATQCPNPKPGLYVELAQCHEALGQLDDAILAYKKAVDLQPENVEWLDQLCLALTHADRLEEAQKIIETIERLREQNLETPALPS